MLYVPGFGFIYVASVLVALLLAYAAWKQPQVGRAAFAALFGIAAWVNFELAATRPDVYLEFAPLAVLDVYRDFILGFFARHVTIVISMIATCQALIALGVFVGGTLARAALIGAIVFLIAIAPLGAGSALPTSLILALGAALLAKRSDALAGSLPARAWRRWSKRGSVGRREARA